MRKQDDMNQQIRNSIFLFFTVLFSLCIFTSCKQFKTEEPKVENVCTLTSEQTPEVRGFQLGMTFEQIVNKYPRLCKLPQETPLFDINITFYINPSGKEDKLKDCSQYNGLLLSFNEYPEFKGVENIDLKITKNRLTSIEIKYESTTDENLANEFSNKTKDSLGLATWSNWETKNEEKVSRDYGLLTTTKIEKNQLLCNRVIFRTEIEKRHFSKIYESDNRNIFYENLFTPSLFIYETEEVSISESQKKQLEEQKRLERKNAVDLKKEEDKKKSETFNP